MILLESLPPTNHCIAAQSLDMTRSKDHGGGLVLSFSNKIPTSLDPPDKKSVEDAKGEDKGDGCIGLF